MSNASTFTDRSARSDGGMSVMTPSPSPRDMIFLPANAIEIDPHGDVLLQLRAQEASLPVPFGIMAMHAFDPGLGNPNRYPNSRHDNGGGGEDEHLDRSPHLLSMIPRTSTDLVVTPPRPTTLLVSSAVLSLISPVFANMFSTESNFAEATAFRAPGSPRPFPIALPEDDPDAFAVLASVAHHRADAIPARPSTQLLVDIAVLADKYACGPALMPYGVLWLQRSLDQSSRASGASGDGESRSLDEYCRMLLFAYALDLPEQFSAISWRILLQHQQGFRDEVGCGLELPIARDHELLRHDIHGELQRRKALIRREINWVLMQPTSHVSSLLSANQNDHSPCGAAAAVVGHYMLLLHRHCLAPWKDQFETDSFEQILQRARDLADMESGNPLFQIGTCHLRGCPCREFAARYNLVRALQDGLERAQTWKLWLCLDCVRTGGESHRKNACRVHHW